MNGADVLKLLVQLAFRNLAAHRVKSLIVGALLTFGTLLVVMGSALLDSIESSMQKSITSSVAGHLQVYSEEAKDPLALFGGLSFGPADIGEINDFNKLETALQSLPEIEAVVPMGLVTPTVFGKNELDGLLERMRDAVRAGDVASAKTLGPQVQAIAKQLSDELGNRRLLSRNLEELDQQKVVLDKVSSDTFWADFETDPLKTLEFLDFEFAPLSTASRIFYFRTLGTDLNAFVKHFDRFRIVDGEMIPEGQQGFLISKRVYEEFVKNKVARELDDIHEQVTEKGATIAETPGLKEQVARNARQYQRILFQLTPADASALEGKLRALIPEEKGDLAALLQSFLTVDDTTLDSRFAFFYAEIAPHIQLYDTPVGSTMTLRSFTKSGYVRSVNVKIYGTFQFDGLERSDLAGSLSLTDMVTLRDLYGKMSDEQRAELKDIKTQVGVADVGRADAEAALFGGSTTLEVTEDKTGFDEFAGVDLAAAHHKETGTKTYTQAQMRDGLALNAAVILKDVHTLNSTLSKIQELSKSQKLGIQVVDWAQASGIVGQFVMVIRSVLYTCIFIIFLVAVVIINNTMVMATMERTFEIGTMRAIGAQRGFVMALFLFETMLLGLIAGGIGSLLSVGVISYLGHVGIPAPADVIVVLFAGPRLYPTITLSNVGFGMSVITFISLLSTFYPARIAATIAPVVAMSGKE